MRIVLAISTLGPGGAERVITLLANELAARGHAVTLVTFEREGDVFFPLAETVSLRRLGLLRTTGSIGNKLLGNLRRILAVRRAVTAVRPDVVVAFITETNVIATLACLGLRVPVVVSERVDPREHPVAPLWTWMRRLVYPLARLLVVQTDGIAAWARSTWTRRPVVTVIPNPVATPTASSSQRVASAGPYVLGVGRLTHQKGMDVLITAFSLAAADIGNVELWIAGTGPDAGRLESLAAERGVAARVRFLGHVRNVHELMADARAFVLASRYEGFPNVLLEALASGAPSIATDCPTGPREILGNGDSGLLVQTDDAYALAEAIRRLVNDPALARRLRESGPVAARRYSVPTIADRWEKALYEAVRA